MIIITAKYIGIALISPDSKANADEPNIKIEINAIPGRPVKNVTILLTCSFFFMLVSFFQRTASVSMLGTSIVCFLTSVKPTENKSHGFYFLFNTTLLCQFSLL